MTLPDGKATSDSRGPAAHHGGLAVHTAQAVEAAVLRDAAPRREPERVGERMTLKGEIETQGRSESRPSRKARRGFGTRRRSKASRPSNSRRTSRERGLATVHGAGEVENAPLPERDSRASGGEVRGFAGDRVGRRCCRKAAEPSLFGGRSTRFDSLALRTGAQAPGGGRWWLWRSGQPAGASPFETRCGRCPANRQVWRLR